MPAASTSRLYYDPARPSGFSTLWKLRLATAASTSKSKKNAYNFIRACLEIRDAYTLHRPVRKRFALNPYTVTNVVYVWECDIVNRQTYAKYNDNHR